MTDDLCMAHWTPLRRVASLLATVAALSTFAPTSASAFSTTNGVRLNAVEARLATLINHARTSRGIPALTVTSGTTDLARMHSLNQATKNLLYHNPNLATDIAKYGSREWRVVAENVGRGWGADSLFDAYMNSPHHRENILDRDVRYLGIGWVERPDGSGYNTQVFVSHYSSTYGRTRRPAVGGLADTRTPTASLGVATFEGGWDPRVMMARTTGAIVTGGPYFATPASGDQSMRFTAHETVAGSGGAAEMRIRDALDLRHATGLRIKMSAISGSGRPVTVNVSLRRELGTTVYVGKITLRSGAGMVTTTLPLPSGAKNFRNAIVVSVPRASFESLSSSLSGRAVSIRVSDIAVMV